MHDDPVRFSRDEYVKLTRVTDRDHELYDGKVLLMTSPSRRHDVLTAWIFNQLYQAFGAGTASGPGSAPEVHDHDGGVRGRGTRS